MDNTILASGEHVANDFVMQSIKEALADLEAEKRLELENTLRFEDEKKNRWMREGHIIVGNELLSNKSVCPVAKVLYLLLMRRLFQKDFCFPGRETLAKELGLSPRQVDRYIQELKVANWIKVVRRGQGKTNYYYLKKS